MRSGWADIWGSKLLWVGGEGYLWTSLAYDEGEYLYALNFSDAVFTRNEDSDFERYYGLSLRCLSTVLDR